jgi:transcriptional regulator with XRE-family HTH domain
MIWPSGGVCHGASGRGNTGWIVRFPGLPYGDVVPEPKTPAETWAESLARSVGRRVAHFRAERGLTAQQLSDELLRRLGFTMKRTVIGNLESGVRSTIGIAEILALAYVLNVPPLLLIAPIGADRMEVLPGMETDPWTAAHWISGDGDPPAVFTEVDDAAGALIRSYRGKVNRLGLYRRHDAGVAEWVRAMRMLHPRDGDEQPSGDAREQAVTRLREIEEGIYALRWMIREHGETPPPLPRPLQHLDEEEQMEGGSTDGSTEDPAGDGRE